MGFFSFQVAITKPPDFYVLKLLLPNKQMRWHTPPHVAVGVPFVPHIWRGHGERYFYWMHKQCLAVATVYYSRFSILSSVDQLM